MSRPDMWLVRLLAQRIEGLVHERACADALERARHESLIASHIAGAAMAALVFGALLALDGPLGPLALFAALWFLSPLAVAAFLSRTGRLDAAHFLSAANLTGIVLIAALLSGGARSFALVWLVVVPLEAALSANLRMMIAATGLAVAALVGMVLADAAGMVPAPTAIGASGPHLALASLLSAVAYAGALAASVFKLHRSSEQALSESRAHYRLIAENTSDLVTRHEAGGAITFASQAAQSILGVTPETLMADGLGRHLSVEDHVRHLAVLARARATGEAASAEFELAPLGASGSSTRRAHWVEIRYQPIVHAASGQAGATVAVMRDITRRKHEELALAAARDEAEQASRSKTAFLASISHELRTPLNSIIGFAEILHRELLIKARDPRHADYCRIIHESGEHLLSLVRDLLDVSKIESGNYAIVAEPFTAAGLLGSAVDAMTPAARKAGVELATDVAPDLPDILADRRACKQILLNLLSNACKFTRAGGRIAIGARASGESIEIEIADTGIGIASEHLARIGRPFYQVDSTYARENDGVGLGLSIVRGLVALQGGSFAMASELGKGTRCTVRLPADRSERIAESDPPAALPAAASGIGRIAA